MSSGSSLVHTQTTRVPISVAAAMGAATNGDAVVWQSRSYWRCLISLCLNGMGRVIIITMMDGAKRRVCRLGLAVE